MNKRYVSYGKTLATSTATNHILCINWWNDNRTFNLKHQLVKIESLASSTTVMDRSKQRKTLLRTLLLLLLFLSFKFLVGWAHLHSELNASIIENALARALHIISARNITNNIKSHTIRVQRTMMIQHDINKWK